MKTRGSRVLVTGGAGNIGSHVVDRLISRGVSEVVVIDNLSRGRPQNLEEARKSKKLRFIKGDISDLELLQKAFVGIDFVVHEAAVRVTQCAQDPRLCQKVLVDGTFNILEACVKNRVRKLVFNSSASVYGDPSYLPMDEDHPFNNRTAYGAGKIANEQMVRAFREMWGLNYIALRPFNVYGPRMDIYGVYTEVMIRWLDSIERNEPPVIYGDGKQSMDFIYVSDVVEATMLALESDINEGVYNVGTGVETDLNSLVRLMLRLSKSKLRPVYKTPEKLVIVSRRQADPRRAKKELGFDAKVKLYDGLKELTRWKNGQEKSRHHG